ncbi:hypothetical protein SLEP1_g271 [Rubroshorea leprosula]|uniref:Cytochrome P450 n=1 Tax=Rubroshorea leprosula TaxID=152421 RepID=A0AAV5HGM2_9ROSI|nr:hypothetical protein SLEP1_g271 [Rubroshorea leprosula]
MCIQFTGMTNIGTGQVSSSQKDSPTINSTPKEFTGYIPFGFGRRSCPGLSFSAAQVEYVLANLLSWFDWKLTDGANAEDLDMAEHSGLST